MLPTLPSPSLRNRFDCPHSVPANYIIEACYALVCMYRALERAFVYTRKLSIICTTISNENRKFFFFSIPPYSEDGSHFADAICSSVFIVWPKIMLAPSDSSAPSPALLSQIFILWLFLIFEFPNVQNAAWNSFLTELQSCNAMLGHWVKNIYFSIAWYSSLWSN